MDEKKLYLLGEAAVSKAVLTMAVPMIMGMMIQLLYNLVDIYFIGKLGDPNQLAAANITTPLFMIMLAFSGIIGTGGASFLSRCMGKVDYVKAGKVLSTAISMCFCAGIATSILGGIFIKPLVNMLGAVEQTYSYTLEYSLVLIFGAAIIMSNFALGQLLRSEGSVVVSMTGMLIGTLMNMILDPLFIFALHMGIKGAAIATVLGNASGLLYYVLFYIRDKSMIKFRFKSISFEKEIWKEIFSIGIPSSVSQLLMGVAVILCNNLVVPYGNTTVAGMGVATKIMTIGTYLFMGFAAGCQPLLGYNFGAKNDNRVKEIIKTGMLMTSGVGISLTILFGFFSQEFVSFFTSLPEVIDKGSMILTGLMWSLPVYGAQMVGAITVQAMGKAKASFLLSMSRQGFFYIPLLLILHRAAGFKGLLLAQPLADLLALILTIVILTFLIRKSKQNVSI